MLPHDASTCIDATLVFLPRCANCSKHACFRRNLVHETRLSVTCDVLIAASAGETCFKPNLIRNEFYASGETLSMCRCVASNSIICLTNMFWTPEPMIQKSSRCQGRFPRGRRVSFKFWCDTRKATRFFLCSRDSWFETCNVRFGMGLWPSRKWAKSPFSNCVWKPCVTKWDCIVYAKAIRTNT